MPIEFFDPPKSLLASGTKKGVEIGGSKSILSIDNRHNFYNEGNIYTEMSWAAFYEEKGLEDQIDTFTTTAYDSIREDPDQLTDEIIRIIYKIINRQKIFYGIADFEVDAFLNQNTTVIPGLNLDTSIINKLMAAHKRTREKNLFPEMIYDDKGIKKIKLEFHGTKVYNLHIQGSKIEDLINRLRLAKGFGVGVVFASSYSKAANFYIISDNIVFSRDELPEFYIDNDNINLIDYGIKRKMLFPISWFRIDIGIRSLETLELWDEIKDSPELEKALAHYERYINALVVKKFKPLAQSEKIGKDLGEEFVNLSKKERKKVLKDMEEAIEFLTKQYKE